DSNKQAQINFTSPIVVAKGTTQSVVVKATLRGLGKYALGVNAAADISATAAINGSFPIVGNTMVGNNVTVGTLAVDSDGSLSAV
ncbi:hypothetical protein, partial [Lactococcus petauri]|uniref:hypothetical protein n=1 Tax=Lactococcus petauri TaxID=1940789 RepID=UPI0021F162AA